MGWDVTRRAWAGDAEVLNHAGSNTVWFTVAWVVPERRRALLLAPNAWTEEAVDAVAARVLAGV
jgi:hypothetical protein